VSAEPDPRHVAEQERDHVAALLAAHERTCPACIRTLPLTDPACPAYHSLAAHLDRTERQLALLAPPAQTGELFG
jgi:hypothetical protein